MGAYIKFFNDIRLSDMAETGGKAANLGELAGSGFNVPEGFCVKASAYEFLLSSNDLHGEISEIASSINFNEIEDVEKKTAKIRKKITSANIPRILSDEIKDAYKVIGNSADAPLVAVRSSVGTKDLKSSSFPGQMDTFHNLKGSDSVIKCIRECWASVWNARAVSTLHAKSIAYHEVIIAPVVQLMIPSTTAGVIFTVNPVNSNHDEIMMDASYGLGEAVVGGDVTPDNYIIAKKEKRILSFSPGEKKYKIVFDERKGAGNTKIHLPEKESKAPCLEQWQVNELIELAIQIENHYGTPQDIEWAYADKTLYTLQSRNIKNLDTSAKEEKKNIPTDPHDVWSRKFGDEYLAGYAMPLNYDLLVRWIRIDYFKEVARLQNRKDLMALEPIRKYNGYAYMSGRYIACMLKSLPRNKRILDSMNWFPDIWEEKIKEEPFQPWLGVGILFAFFRDHRVGIKKNIDVLDIHCQNIKRIIMPRIVQDYKKLSLEEWRRQFDEVNEFGKEHFRVIRWGVGFNNPIFHNLLSKLLVAWADDTDGALYQSIISGLTGTWTAEINHSIWKLGQTLKADQKLVDLFLKKQFGYQEMRSKQPDAHFWQSFDRFIQIYGHRAATREISEPRWRETPDIITNLVRAQLQEGKSPEDPEKVASQSIARRKEAEALVLEKMGNGIWGRAKRRFIRFVYETTQNYTIYRENQRFFLDYILTHMRELIIEQGRRLTEKNILNEPFEIFFLEKEEFWEAIYHPSRSDDFREKIEKRKAHYNEWKNKLPATYLYDDIEVEEDFRKKSAVADVPENILMGLGASRGKIKGKVRIIDEIKHLDQVKSGEILVVNNIDPGWTNVFPFIAGLVTETGGLLAHGALLAREYSIPAIMGVPDATKKLSNGEIIEIDGKVGDIRLGHTF